MPSRMTLLRKALPVLALSLLSLSQSLGTQIRADGHAVVVNGVEVFRIETGLDGVSPDQRARQLAAKLDTLAFWGQTSVKTAGPNRLLIVSGEPVLTVTPAEAAAQHCSLDELGDSWSKRLRDALSLPPLKVSDNYVRLPQGGEEQVRIMGSNLAHLTVSIPPGDVAKVSRSGDVLKIVGKTVGHETVSVSAGKEMENIDVQVLPYAAAFPQTLGVSVTGAPATERTVQGAIEGALRTRLQTVSNAHWTFTKVEADSLATGTSRTYIVHASVTGPDSYPSGGRVEVVVKNTALPPRTDENLWYSNNPETLRGAGPLFSASLERGGSARLLYHHMNGTMQDMFVRVEAINRSDKAAQIELIPGDSAPNQDPVRAGVAAADQFMQNWQSGSGEVVTLPANSALPISLRRLSPGEVCSGLCSIRLIDGPDQVLVRTDAIPPLPLDEKWRNAIFSSTPWREVGTHVINTFDKAPYEASLQIYPKPYASRSVDYEVGGPLGFLQIGAKGIARQDAARILDGNFGVIYNIKANLKNPTADPADIELAYEASGGYSGGIFIINGSYVKTPLLLPKAVTTLAKYHLMPGATESVDITTLPISGSSYPATLMIRPATQAAAMASNSRR